MATYTVFGNATPAAPNETDADGSYGTVINVEDGVTGTVTHARWRFPNTLPSGPVTWHLYDLTNAEALAEHTFEAPVAGAWVEEELDGVGIEGPQVLIGPVQVIAWVGTPDRYVATGGFFMSHAEVNGPLTSPATQDTPNGRFGGDPNSVPNGEFNGGCYFADMVFEVAEPQAEGTAAFGLELVLASTGDAPVVPPAEGVAAIGLGLAVASTGDAPPIDPGEGAAGFELAFTLAGTGDTPPVSPGEGTAAFGLGLALASTGDAPDPSGADGVADFGIVYSFSGTGDTPDPGEASGTASFGLGLALAASGIVAAEGSASFSLALVLASTGDSDQPFVCTPVRSFAEVMPS